MATVTFTIPDNKLADFKVGFLRRIPNNEKNEDSTPMFTDNEWIKEWGKRQYLSKYKDGKQQIANEAASIDNDIIT